MDIVKLQNEILLLTEKKANIEIRISNLKNRIETFPELMESLELGIQKSKKRVTKESHKCNRKKYWHSRISFCGSLLCSAILCYLGFSAIKISAASLGAPITPALTVLIGSIPMIGIMASGISGGLKQMKLVDEIMLNDYKKESPNRPALQILNNLLSKRERIQGEQEENVMKLVEAYKTLSSIEREKEMLRERLNDQITAYNNKALEEMPQPKLGTECNDVNRTNGKNIGQFVNGNMLKGRK